ncbi:uncharacterized protein LOC117271524 isoform X1 [Epinephelus lanceolatus]
MSRCAVLDCTGTALSTIQEPGVSVPRRRSPRLKDKPENAKAKTEAKPKPKKGPAKSKKAKEVEKAKPDEKAPDTPAENGEAKAEEETPATNATEQKDEAAE